MQLHRNVHVNSFENVRGYNKVQNLLKRKFLTVITGCVNGHSLDIGKWQNLTLHRIKTLSRLNFLMKIGRFAFLRPPLGDLGATYDDHLRLIGKRVPRSGLPILALIELFSLGVTAEALRAIIG